MSGCVLAIGMASAAGAQSPYAPPAYTSPFAPLTDADRLAQQLRIVAANPTDLYALVAAANLSLKVGDTDAAAALFTRADRISPQHPRVKAGMARLLVQAGRPGEALRRFQDAERFGATMADFGADRALAYDLVGEQQRAQREYRALLRIGSDDETIRRYALSLGISGLKESALALLEPLNRRGDRGAWRVRAFVLAMTGDRPGAERIAATMMPAGMGQRLDPFFERLPRLGPGERAFAVNFGETRASPTRLADARLVPPLPALTPEPDPFPKARVPVQVAAVRDDDGRKTRRRSKRDRSEPVRIAATQSYVQPLPPPPAPTAAQLASLTATPLPPSPFRAAGVTVLPPPADAYRGSATRVATSAASRDEPDFAVEAVSTLAAGNRPASAAPPPVVRATPRPVTLAAAEPRMVPDGSAIVMSSVAPTSLPVRPGSATPAPSVSLPPAGALASLTEAPAPGLGEFRLTGPITTPASGPPAITPDNTVAAGSLALRDAAPGSTPSAAVSDRPTGAAETAATIPLPGPLAPTDVGAQPLSASPTSADAGTVAPTTTAVADQTDELPPSPAAAAITPATGAPPPPKGTRGDDVLAAIVAGIAVPEAEPAGTFTAPPAVSAPAGRPRLLANVEKKAEADKAKALVGKTGPNLSAAAPVPALPAKDRRGRFVDTKGKPLLDARGRPLGPKAAAAWQAETRTDPAAEPDLRKDGRGRFLDAKGKPLLDTRGRPLDAKAAAARLAAEAKKDAKPDAALPARDARGRFVDAKGKPLLDARGRPLDTKAAAAWKVAEAKKVADAKKKPDPGKSEPQRFWVQVAGGANEATLGKEWVRLAGQTPSLKGKSGWTTPLRATNRVLTGPFKSGGEAMALVNQLKKEGVSAFMFTSDPGQKVTRLGAK